MIMPLKKRDAQSLHTEKYSPRLSPGPIVRFTSCSETASPRTMAINRRATIAAVVVFSAIVLAVALAVCLRPRQTAAVIEPPVPNAAGVTSVRKEGAVCLDGSTPQYHLDPGSGAGADSWVLHLEGGAWCGTVELCLDRSTTWLGSTLYTDPQEFDGIMSSVSSENPDFYNWNRVVVRYCDGASFAGNVNGEFEQNGAKLFFRGQQIWEAIMSDLMSKGLADAKMAFLTGCSAGGLATFLHCDQFRKLLPKVGTVKCLSDAGFILDVKDISGKDTVQSYFNDVVNLQATFDGDFLYQFASRMWRKTYKRIVYQQQIQPSVSSHARLLNI